MPNTLPSYGPGWPIDSDAPKHQQIKPAAPIRLLTEQGPYRAAVQ